jgi:phytoene dehydrogenase-like protein
VTVGPIFVTADEPVLVFESLDRALASLEWQDVEDGIYRGYDGDGRAIEFDTENRRVVAEVESDPGHAGELRATLARVLDLPEATPLDRLKTAAVARFGLT